MKVIKTNNNRSRAAISLFQCLIYFTCSPVPKFVSSEINDDIVPKKNVPDDEDVVDVEKLNVKAAAQ